MNHVTLQSMATSLEAASKDVAAAVDRAGSALAVQARAGAMQHFERQQAPDGTPWAPLKFPRIRGGSRILMDTGHLRSAVQGYWENGEVVLKAKHPGAKTHQYGATITPKRKKFLVFAVGTGKKRGKGRERLVFAKKVTIPARPYLGFSDDTLRKMGALLARVAGNAVALKVVGGEPGRAS